MVPLRLWSNFKRCNSTEELFDSNGAPFVGANSSAALKTHLYGEILLFSCSHETLAPLAPLAMKEKITPSSCSLNKNQIIDSTYAIGAECIYFLYKQVINYPIYQRQGFFQKLKVGGHISGNLVEQQAKFAISQTTSEVFYKIDSFPFSQFSIVNVEMFGSVNGVSRLILPWDVLAFQGFESTALISKIAAEKEWNKENPFRIYY